MMHIVIILEPSNVNCQRHIPAVVINPSSLQAHYLFTTVYNNICLHVLF